MDLLRSFRTVLNPEVENSDPVLGQISVRQKGLVDVFPGPALLVNVNLEVLHYNEAAKPILEALMDIAGSVLESRIYQAIQMALPAQEVFSFGEGESLQVFDLTLLPLSDREGEILITAKNVTLQKNLVNALVTSRQLFKDLVTCTAEFVWETDVEGCFRYVSPRGAIGFSAAELDGRIAREMIVASEGEAAEQGPNIVAGENVNPFESRDPQQDQIIWLRDKYQGLACMRVSSIPVFDENGNWTGCRGAGHDITEAVAQRTHLDRLAAQEKTLSRIIDAIRHEIDPGKLFEIAARGACDALNSTRIWLGRENTSGVVGTAYMLGVDEQVEKSICQWFDERKTSPLNEYELVELEAAGWRIFISPILSGTHLDGGIALVRREEATELDDSEFRLLRLISEHLGVALIQIKAREKLEMLSRTDELTKLLNRRAFNEDVVKRLEHSKRSKNGSALFYIDLDNFKPVNDSFGHEKGDEVLIGVSDLLQRHTRIEDMVARLGGDEFAMWLEDISMEMAIAKAQEMQEHCKTLSKKLGILDPALSFSIGIAGVDGERDETLDELLAEADAAMYVVKEKGKGTYSVGIKLPKEMDELHD